MFRTTLHGAYTNIPSMGAIIPRLAQGLAFIAPFLKGEIPRGMLE
jgi:hypothetical protein